MKDIILSVMWILLSISAMEAFKKHKTLIDLVLSAFCFGMTIFHVMSI